MPSDLIVICVVLGFIGFKLLRRVNHGSGRYGWMFPGNPSDADSGDLTQPGHHGQHHHDPGGHHGGHHGGFDGGGHHGGFDGGGGGGGHH